jgi:hypothetical protein
MRVVGSVLAAAVALQACAQVIGIDGEYGDRPGADASIVTDGSTDAHDGATLDQGANDAVADSVTPSCESAPDACTGVLPADWELVLFAPDRDTACPAGFVQRDIVADPVVGADACDCSCAVDSASSCTMGQLSTGYGTTTSCTSSGLPLDVTGSDCIDFGRSVNFSSYFSATLMPADVTCNVETLIDSAKVTSTEMRACDVPSACRDAVCDGDVAAGLSVCVMSDGDVTCPSGWDTRTVVGDSADLSCSSCTCEATAGCTGGRVSFFSDNACAQPLIEFDVNDTCQPTNSPGSTMSFSYAATLTDAQCTADGPKTASVTLTGTRTVCCK